MDTKLKVISGFAGAFAASAIYYFFKENNKSLNQKMLDQMSKLKKFIDFHFYDCPKEQVQYSSMQLSNKLEDRKEFINLLNEIATSFFDADRLNEEVSRHPYYKQFLRANQQVPLFNQEYTSQYLRKNSLDAVYQNVNTIASKQTLLEQQQPQLSNNASQFVSFFYILLIFLIREIENTLLDLSNKHGLIEVNFLLSGLLDYLDMILKQYPILANMIGVALLGQLQLQDPHLGYGHKCDDLFYTEKLDENNGNKDCKCTIFETLLRYASLITPTLQKKLITLLIDYQIISTTQHLAILGRIILKYPFYMNSQISQDSMYYVQDVSVFNHLLMQATAHKTIRQQLITPDVLDMYFLYNERLIAQNNTKFIAKVLSSVIASHVMVYPIFGDEDSLGLLLSNEKQQILVSVHFMGILLILETKDTFDIKDNPNQQMLDWLAQNMDFMLATEVLTFLQLQFLNKIFTSKTSDKVLLMKQYLQCLRVTQNKRITDKQMQKKRFETNAALTKIFGYLIATQITELPSKDTLVNIVQLMPFQDETERNNIFTNSLRILFDLPTMNFHFLKYIQAKCEKISQDSVLSYTGYFTHVLSAQTISFDTYMFTLQLSMLFGKVDALMGEICVRMERDFQDFKTYEDFLTRDLIMLVDILENPYYCMNVLAQAKIEFPGKQELMKQLFQYAAISILKLNEQMTLMQLLDTLQLFVYLQDIPQYIKELVEELPDGKIKLRQQYSQNWPYMSLQKDMESVKYSISKAEDPFDELLYAPPSFPYLFEIRTQLFASQYFINLIKSALGSSDRMQLYVWIAKLLYYGKQQLLKKGAPLVEALLATAECQSFVQSLEEKHPKLVQYLRT